MLYGEFDNTTSEDLDVMLELAEAARDGYRAETLLGKHYGVDISEANVGSFIDRVNAELDKREEVSYVSGF